jgi:hypothetical protein
MISVLTHEFEEYREYSQWSQSCGGEVIGSGPDKPPKKEEVEKRSRNKEKETCKRCEGMRQTISQSD